MSMSFENIAETGNGGLSYRLRIFGCPTEFVTDGLRMAQTITSGSVTITRVGGLLRNGITISEQAILPEGKIEIQGNNFSIVDLEGRASRAFFTRSQRRGELLATYSDTSTNMRFSTPTFPLNSIIWMGSEAIQITSAPLTGSVGAQYDVARGIYGTQPQWHRTTSELGVPIRPFAQDAPFGFENQRVELYAYGDNDDPLGDGTLIWRGIVIEEPKRIDGAMKWNIVCGPITEVFSSEIGVEIEDVGFRGYFFGGELVNLRASWRGIGGGILTAPAENVSVPIFQNRYFDNMRQLGEAIARGLNANRPFLMGNISFGYEVIGGELVLAWFANYSSGTDPVIFNWTLGTGTDDLFDPTVWRLTSTGRFVPAPSGLPGRNVYYARFREDLRPFPSTIQAFGAASLVESRRLYLDRRIDALDTGLVNSVMLMNDDDDIIDDAWAIDLNPTNPALGSGFSYVRSSNYIVPQFSPGRRFATFDEGGPYKLKFGVTLKSGGTVVDLLENLVGISPRAAGSGIIPTLYPEDFDFADMRMVLNSLSIPRTMKFKRWTFYTRGQKLEDILSSEFQQLGVYPCLTPNGKLTIRPIRTVSSADRFQHVLNADNILTDGEFPLLSTNDYGLWNAMTVKTGWNPVEEEHMGNVLNFNDIRAIQQNNNKIKRIELEEFSQQAVDIEPEGSLERLQQRSQNYLPVFERTTALFGRTYFTVSLEVPFNLYNSAIGDTIRISSNQLPSTFSFDGTRFGQSVYIGFIVGRDFDLETGFASLKILVTDEIVDAFFVPPSLPANTVIAPTSPVTSASVDGDFLDIILDNFRNRLPTFPQTVQIQDLMRAGDIIQLREYDSFNPFSSPATLVSFTDIGNDQMQVRVEFPGGVPSQISDNPNAFDLGFAPLEQAAAASLIPSENQQTFAIVDSGLKDGGIDIAISSDLVRRIRL